MTFIGSIGAIAAICIIYKTLTMALRSILRALWIKRLVSEQAKLKCSQKAQEAREEENMLKFKRIGGWSND